jgi:osmotically-inducible protein OsmY
MKSDSEIQQAVLREMKWDSRVEETDVGVEVDDGVVTLTGTVDNYAKRLAAQEAAHRVEGVLDVANDVKVRLPGATTRTDTEIAQAVRQALEWDVTVPDEEIQTTVSNGAVTLDGKVSFAFQRWEAVRAVRHLVGVQDVVDNIVVSGAHIDPSMVRTEITEALERRADRSAKRIRVSVDDGRVTLSGQVHSWAEKEAVLGAARFTPGVSSVDDRLWIEPDL